MDEIPATNMNSPLESVALGDGVTIAIGSDRYAYTILYISHDGRFIVVQRDTARLIDGSPMGEKQVYEYFRHPDGEVKLLQRYYHPDTNEPYYRPYGSKPKDGWRVAIGGRREHRDPHV